MGDITTGFGNIGRGILDYHLIFGEVLQTTSLALLLDDLTENKPWHQLELVSHWLNCSELPIPFRESPSRQECALA